MSLFRTSPLFHFLYGQYGAHAFFNGMGAGFLLICLVVGILLVRSKSALFSVSSFFGQRQLVVACPCPQFIAL